MACAGGRAHRLRRSGTRDAVRRHGRAVLRGLGMTGLRQIGSTGVRVPALGFGAAAIGNLYQPVADGVAEQAVHAALANGITYFDTAPHYGFGLSESRLGAALEIGRAHV